MKGTAALNSNPGGRQLCSLVTLYLEVNTMLLIVVVAEDR